MKRPFLLKKRGKYWYYRLASEIIFHTTGEKSRAKAESYIFSLLKRAKRLSPGTVTLKSFASGFFDQTGEWVTRQHKRGRSFSSAISQMRNAHLDNHILPVFGERFIDDIKMHELEDWLLELELSPQTVNHIRYTLNLIFREAKRKNLVSMNPIADIEPLPNKYRERSAFTLEECRKLFPIDWDELVKVWKYPLWAVMHYLMLTTGMRVGEIAALLWKHIVWEKRGILILQAIKADGSVGFPKNGKPRAAIIPERTIELLRKWQDITPYSSYEDYVFFGKDGRTHLNVKYISKVIKPALKRADIIPGDRILVTHSLRHTYNTRMERLIPDAVLRYMIGHQSRKMTERYTHVEPADRLEQLAESQGLLDEVWN